MSNASNTGSSGHAISVTLATNSPISCERASAKTRASALTESRMREITPRLRKSGRASGRSFCRILCTLARTQNQRVRQRIARFTIPGILQSTMAAKPKPGKKPWSGRFAEPVSDSVKRYTASVHFDRRLAQHDVRASLAHARMLRAAGILSAADLRAIERGLSRISREIESGGFRWSLEAEDVHLNIERRLIGLGGEAGKRLRPARSRTDQVATDLRLWLRDAIDAIGELLRSLQRRLLDQAEKHAATLMPGFTHPQVAQPVTFGHHLLAYFEMLAPDRSRLADCRRRVNHRPLGGAALAGPSVPIARARLARPLPVKAGKQEAKQPLFDAAAPLRATLAVSVELIAGLRVNAAAMRAAAEEGFATATDRADYLVRKGLAFRDAHEAAARAVRFAEESGRGLQQLTLDELRRFSGRVGSDVQRVLTLEGSVASRSHIGGTAPAQRRAPVRRARHTPPS